MREFIHIQSRSRMRSPDVLSKKIILRLLKSQILTVMVPYYETMTVLHLKWKMFRWKMEQFFKLAVTKFLHQF